MTLNRWRETAVACLILTIAACNQQPQPQAAPTLQATSLPTATVATATRTPTATPIVRDTLPPTWTPILSYTPSITFTPSITLTPSITPTPSDTPTSTYTPSITPTPTSNATDAALLRQPLAPECANFGADTKVNNGQFKFGSSVTVGWTAVSSAAVYVLRLYDSNQSTLVMDKITDNAYTFSADQFPTFQNYAWTVAPLNNDGVQICPSRGGLLLPTP